MNAYENSAIRTETPVVVITGALAGIGRATAFAFARQPGGAKLVVSGRRDDAGDALVEELRALGGEAEFVRADVRHEADVQRMVDRAVARFGRLDVAVNNAGTDGKRGAVVELTPEMYHEIFDTNVLGTVLSMKHELRVMLAQKSGAIINLSSIQGTRPSAYASVYAASKHAIDAFTKSAALEVAQHGIRVNALAPGATDTEMLSRFAGTPERKATLIGTAPMRRMAHVDEMANAILFLASSHSSYMTGHILAVDGGRS